MDKQICGNTGEKAGEYSEPLGLWESSHLWHSGASSYSQSRTFDLLGVLQLIPKSIFQGITQLKSCLKVTFDCSLLWQIQPAVFITFTRPIRAAKYLGDCFKKLWSCDSCCCVHKSKCLNCAKEPKPENWALVIFWGLVLGLLFSFKGSGSEGIIGVVN